MTLQDKLNAPKSQFRMFNVLITLPCAGGKTTTERARITGRRLQYGAKPEYDIMIYSFRCLDRRGQGECGESEMIELLEDNLHNEV